MSKCVYERASGREHESDTVVLELSRRSHSRTLKKKLL